MRITLRQLAVFEAIARHGSVSRGAEEVALSQSAASMALKELESGLRMTLFHRSGKQLALNENGRRIQPMVRSLLAQAREIEHHGPPQEMSGVLRVGASTGIGSYLLGATCAAFARQFPLVRLKLQVAYSGEVIRRVESMACDFGLIESPCNRATLNVESLAEEELVVVAAPGHPLTSAARVTPADLRAAAWCLGDIDSYTRQMVTLGLGQGGLTILLESNSLAAVKSAVLAGMGLGCISRGAVAQELASGALTALRVEGLPLRRTLSLIYPKGIYQGPPETAFIESVRHTLGEPRYVPHA